MNTPKTKHYWILFGICTVLGMISGEVFSYPTSCNIIPTADMLAVGEIRLEYENDGFPRVGSSDSLAYGFVQVGLTPRLECGVDRWDIAGDAQDSLNLKYLVAEETSSHPAIAVGTMDLAKGNKASYYGVGTKSFGKFRFHAGYIYADYAKGLMVGCDQELARDTYLLADWMHGAENYLTVGIYQEVGKGTALTLTYGFPNDRTATNLCAINVSYTFLARL